MSTDHLWTATFTAREAFVNWAIQVMGDGKAWALLERVPDHWMTEPEREDGLKLEPYHSGLPFAQYESGCVFCADYELRWECSRSAVSARYLGHTRPDFGAEGVEEAVVETSETIIAYTLWGERVAGSRGRSSTGQENAVFATLRIPRLLTFPVTRAAPPCQHS